MKSLPCLTDFLLQKLVRTLGKNIGILATLHFLGMGLQECVLICKVLLVYEMIGKVLIGDIIWDYVSCLPALPSGTFIAT